MRKGIRTSLSPDTASESGKTGTSPLGSAFSTPQRKVSREVKKRRTKSFGTDSSLSSESTARESNLAKFQIRETMDRYNRFTAMVEKATKKIGQGRPSYTERIDNITTHRVLGPIIFTAIMLLVFQAIYAWAEWPMTIIEDTFIGLSNVVSNALPEGWFTNLLTEGIIAGLGGIMVFIPQIAILFFLISVLEEIGYMSRVVFMFDGLMQRFGLNGRSIVALISGGACAIPAILSARTISN